MGKWIEHAVRETSVVNRPCMTKQDVFAVDRRRDAGALVFEVCHYLSETARGACCVVQVRQKRGESDGDTLRRAAREIERNHGI